MTTKKKKYLAWKRWTRKNPEKYQEIKRKYRIKNLERLRMRARIYQGTATGLWVSLNSRNNRRKKLPIISKEKFAEWFSKQDKICFYCFLPESMLPLRGFSHRGTFRLTIDRIDNSRGYIAGNIVLACSRCNMTKSDFFSLEEMKIIAKKFITPKWKISKHE